MEYYGVTAVEVWPDGMRVPIQITRDYSGERGARATLAFKLNSDLCGGPGTTSFVERGILYVARPNR